MLNKAIINLKNLKENALKIKEKLGKTKLCAVIKADAYGHGAEMVASALYNIADCFAVALVEEGVFLRLSGINKEILVLLPPFLQDVKRGVAYDLAFTVENTRQLALLEQECLAQNKFINVHLKINSGMNRLGIDELEELKKIVDFASGLKRVKIGGVYSHYACPQNKNLLEKATDKFLLANTIVKGYNNKVTSHISASGGFLMGKTLDMVRIGLLLYGYAPFETDFSVKPVMKVYAPIVKKRFVEKGQQVLYGDCPLQEDVSACVVRYGYADGLPRMTSQGLINNRCMDVCAIKGDFNKNFYPIMTNADALAKQYNTISYEILTKSAIRAEKIYID